MKNKLVIMITIAVLTWQFSACQINTSATNTSSNPVEKTKTEIVNVTNDEPNSETETDAPSAPEPVVLEFYKLYLKALVANKNLSPDVMKRYLTTRMLSEIKDTTDADVVTQGQDYDETWANNVIIKGKEKLSDTKAVLTVELKGKEFSKTLKVTVAAQGNTWKIDAVKDTAAVEDNTDSADNANVSTTIVKFPKGKTGADYEKTISPGETHIYVVNIRKGQYFGAQTYTDDYGIPFTMRLKDGEELEVPADSVKWGGDAPETGDYEIIVSGLEKATKYNISIGAQ